MAATDLLAADERFHAPGAQEQWSDSLYFGGGDAASGLAFYTRIGARPNEGHVEAALGVWLPPRMPGHPPRFLLAFARAAAPEPLAGAAIAAGPVAYGCTVPFERWTVSVDGRARLFARAEDLGEHPDAHQEITVAGELVFTAWTPPFAFASGLSETVALRHYEQPGAVSGTLAVGSERFTIDGAGMRDHSWGVRDWQGVPYWRWMGILVDAENFVLVNNVGMAGGGESVGGCLMQHGELAPIVAGRTEGRQRDFVAHARDALGREAVLRGAALSIAPLRQRRDGRLTIVNEGLTRVEWLGHERLAISEWLVQSDA